ncbi:MAG: DUF4388 domain-containing protein [Anaerolineales bacterium]|nr:DUF4388 domain-containing protein [Anaerolineales bacterium]
MVEVLRGNLAQLSLMDILQMLSAGNRSGLLDIHQGTKKGEIYLQNGTLVHAVTGKYLGEKGLFTLIGWMEGDFSFTPDIEAPEKSIEETTEQILLEAARQAGQWEDIKEILSTTDAVFNISASGSTNTVSLKPIEWQVLAQVNGERSGFDIADLLELHEFEVAKIIYSLTTAGLLHEVAGATNPLRETVEESFFEQLEMNFTEVMGPIGPVIVEDEIRLLGEDRQAFPQNKAAELVESVSLEISDNAKRAQFQKQMVAVIRGKH